MRNLRITGWILPAIVLGAASVRAQSDVVTTYDGQQAYFSSYGRLPGATDQPLWTTIFHYSGGSWTAVAHSTDKNNVTKPFVSGDGSLVGWVTGPRGEAGPSDSAPLSYVPSLGGIDPQTIKIPAFAWGLSANGRFLATPGFPYYYVALPPAVEDLSTGQVWNPFGMSSNPYLIMISRPANDGTLVAVRANPGMQPEYTLVRWRPGDQGSVDLISAAEILGVSLSANGKAAAISTQQSDSSVQVQWINLETGTAQVLAPQPAWYASTSITDDGTRVLYFVPDNHAGVAPQVYLWDRNSGLTTTLPGLEDGAVSATISGNGGFAWVATKTNRLVRVDLNQGSFQEILSAFPVTLRQDTSVVPSTPVSGLAVPGSAVRFAGAAPIADEHFVSGSAELPILPPDQTASTLLQVPWEFSAGLPAQGLGTLPLVLKKDGYPFELPLSFGATDQVMPVLQSSSSGNFMVKAVPADFSYLIDASHPAVAGSTIVVWMTGLGQLDRPVATGAVGPANPPAHPLAHLECGLGGGGGPAWQGVELPFIGYAPGLVGVYQVNVKIPADWPTSTPALDCYSGGQITILNLPVAAAP